MVKCDVVEIVKIGLVCLKKFEFTFRIIYERTKASYGIVSHGGAVYFLYFTLYIS